MKCSECRNAEVLDTKWDRVRIWFFRKLFKRDIEDLRMDYYTMGISQGYKEGFRQACEYKNLKEGDILESAKEFLKDYVKEKNTKLDP